MNPAMTLARQVNQSLAAGVLTHDGTATLQTGWVDVQGCSRIQLRCSAAATITAVGHVDQATSNAGAGEKVAASAGQLGATLVNAAIVYAAASGEVVYDIHLDDSDLDGLNGFRYIALTLTCTVGEAVPVACQVIAYPIAYTTPYGS